SPRGTREVWQLSRKQHWSLTRTQQMRLGYGSEEIRQRILIGRLHRVMRGVYAVGRPELDAHGRWMAAGRMPLRFTHWQVAREPKHVQKMLAVAARRLAAAAPRRSV
ncbi:MAG: hypothetical protein JWM24_312, partial [Solirubrobacterales bacterium]|nr:hypothetical protein [Solirubrobacterales bacterium]